jgi:hypothetical protein
LPKAGTVTYQAVQNLLPDILLVLRGEAFLAPLLNRGKPVLAYSFLLLTLTGRLCLFCA